ncbi:MAG: response regulator [Deltaproteobacteria bacterium]|nr:response regulator [Deltaproteobacteria bacterium]MBW2018932.1 response regulator [Deltaproteobacteria bacterium]MBW2073147.1 response regulator [Deltaproteobacteria bacterium]RLB83766.1 MAG: hypothetical protein DRH17_01010 [Deltaproteobacteria bacterium]
MKQVQASSIRTVIVDDDRTIGDILRDLISKEHVSVEVFNDGFEALQFIKKQPVDILITDLVMPRIGGLEVLRRAKITNPDVVVIIITGHASLETAIEAVREGAYDYIKKPFKLQEMEIVFNNAVERVTLIRENRQLLKELKEAYDQLVAIKKERTESNYEDKEEEDRMDRLNFFSRDLLGLHLMHTSPIGKPNYFEQLQNISMLKKDGLLTEKEFNAFKAHLLKAMKAHE